MKDISSIARHFSARSGRHAVSGLLAVTVLCSACKPAQQTAAPSPDAAASVAPEPARAQTGKQYPEPPAPEAPKPVDFPDVESFTLDSGLTVYVVENHEVPLVSAELVIRAGAMDDERIAEMTAQMLGEGTKSRTKAKIDEAIEFVGGTLSAGSGMHATYLDAEVLSKDLKLALTLMADQVMNPAFPTDALEKLKTQLKTSIQGAKASPQMLASRLFDMVAYPEGHPYGRPLPTDAEIDAVTREDVAKFHATFYRSNNAFLILSGDVTRAVAEPLVKRAFERWQPADPNETPPNPLNKFERFEAPKELVVHLVDRPGSAQAEVIIGNVALSRNHEDYEKLLVASTLLGHPGMGRLFRDVREEKGLTYNIVSRLSDGQAPGTFSVESRTRTKTTGDLLKAMFEHIAAMHAAPPPDAELQTVVQHEVGSFPLSIETADQVTSKLREQLTYYLPDNYWETYRDEISQVTPKDVQAVASRFMFRVPHVVIVGNAKKLTGEIKKALPDAKIVSYDTDLERQ